MNRMCETRRKFERFALPVALDIPAFSDLPLIPEDVSAGGVMVVVSQKPDSGKILDCAMKVTGGAEFRCRARIVWERDNGTDPASWSVGLTFDLSKEEQQNLNTHVEELVSEYWGAQSVSVSAESR
ncbi:MAG: PilZ domain-containing protein [bacterium]